MMNFMNSFVTRIFTSWKVWKMSAVFIAFVVVVVSSTSSLMYVFAAVINYVVV